MVKTPVHLITGFLGSGKTTLVQRLLDKYAPEKKVAVIQNEFAPHNFDGKELRRLTTREFDILEVNNGSVFCVCLLSGFIQSFIKFFDQYQPELILFEASGLSDPVSVGELFNSQEMQKRVFLESIICIIDAGNFMKLKKLQQRMIHQLQIANKIILNKIDLVDDYNETLKELNRINPYALKNVSTFCNVETNQFMNHNAINELNKEQYRLISGRSGRPEIKSIVFKTSKPVKSQLFTHFLKEITAQMVRLKGYVVLDSGETLTLQYSGENLETERIDRDIKQTEIIAMGYQISPADFKKIFQQYC